MSARPEHVHIVFLDIDGVLNTDEFLCRVQSYPRGSEEHADDGAYLDPRLVRRLDRLCREASAKVVVSSSWRLMDDFEDIRQWLAQKGLTAEVIGKTPYLPNAQRGTEIRYWLDVDGKRMGVSAYVVLDDGSDMDAVRSRFIQTSDQEGLTDEQVDRAVQLLTEDVF